MKSIDKAELGKLKSELEAIRERVEIIAVNARDELDDLEEDEKNTSDEEIVEGFEAMDDSFGDILAGISAALEG